MRWTDSAAAPTVKAMDILEHPASAATAQKGLNVMTVRREFGAV